MPLVDGIDDGEADASQDAVYEEVTKRGQQLVSELPPAGRDAALIHLLRDAVGPLSFKDVEGSGFLPFRSYKLVEPGCSEMIAVMCLADFRPRRMVILEPMILRWAEDEIVEYKDVQRAVGPWWWREVVWVTEKVGSRKVGRWLSWRVSRDIWGVNGFFIGSLSQFATTSEMPGGTFAPDGNRVFDGSVAQAGATITVGVKNNSLRAAPFQAVVLGKFPGTKEENLQNMDPFGALDAAEQRAVEAEKRVVVAEKRAADLERELHRVAGRRAIDVIED